jgi:hypothetical protein
MLYRFLWRCVSQMLEAEALHSAAATSPPGDRGEGDRVLHRRRQGAKEQEVGVFRNHIYAARSGYRSASKAAECLPLQHDGAWTLMALRLLAA